MTLAYPCFHFSRRRDVKQSEAARAPALALQEAFFPFDQRKQEGRNSDAKLFAKGFDSPYFSLPLQAYR